MIITVAAVLLSFSALTNGVPSLGLVGAFIVASSASNLLAWLISRTGTFHPSFTVVAFLLDLAIATVPIAAIGSGGLLVGLVAVALPYTLHSSGVMSSFQIAISAFSYVAAITLHGVYVTFPSRVWTDLPVQVLGEVGLFVVVAVALRLAGRRINERLRTIRSAVPHSDDEPFTAQSGDEITGLEDSLRALSRRIESAVTGLSSDARRITEFAVVVCTSARRANDATATLVQSSSTAIDGLEIQRRGAEAGERRSATAIEYARELGEKATTVTSEVNALLQFAEVARKQIQHSHEALTSIEYDVGGTVDAIEALNKTAITMNETLQDVLGIARQAHVLALNSAIKSANGETSAQTSSEIAARFRSLAADTSGSTRGAAQLVDEMQEHIAVADRAMRAGQVQARDAVMFTEAAVQVLDELHLAALRSSELTGASVDVTRIQTEHLKELSKHLADAAASRVDTTQHVASASDAMSRHKAAMDELESAGSLLAATADRMQRQCSLLSASHEASAQPNNIE